MTMQKKIGNTAHQLKGKGYDDSESSDDDEEYWYTYLIRKAIANDSLTLLQETQALE